MYYVLTLTFDRFYVCIFGAEHGLPENRLRAHPLEQSFHSGGQARVPIAYNPDIALTEVSVVHTLGFDPDGIACFAFVEGAEDWTKH